MPLLFLHLPVSAAYLLHFCIWLSPSVFLCLTFFLDLSFSFFLMQSDVYLFLRIRFGNFAYFCLNSTYTFSILFPFHLWTNLHFFPSVCLTFFYLYLSFYLLDLQTQIFFSWAHLHTKTKETVLFFEESFRDDFLTIFCSTCCRDFKQSRWTNERIQTVKFMLTNRLRTYSTYNWSNTLCIRQAYSRYQVKDCPRCKFF